jgi:hypothetical protein
MSYTKVWFKKNNNNLDWLYMYNNGFMHTFSHKYTYEKLYSITKNSI